MNRNSGKHPRLDELQSEHLGTNYAVLPEHQPKEKR